MRPLDGLDGVLSGPGFLFNKYRRKGWSFLKQDENPNERKLCSCTFFLLEAQTLGISATFLCNLLKLPAPSLPIT